MVEYIELYRTVVDYTWLYKTISDYIVYSTIPELMELYYYTPDNNCSAWSRLKLNTKIGLDTNHPPTTHPPPTHHKLLGHFQAY